ncbi:MAG TPA: response regulator [Candidatus Saccharimonadales bacterium]|nr:response regulator [Candidatus Saccharimonadales bacterium]
MTKDILIIEPSRPLADILETSFSRKGYSAAAVHNAQDGITAADKHMPKLIILELVMPNHNGMEFIQEFRSYPEWLEVPVIIYSHIAPSELDLSEGKLRGLGIIAHFYKPQSSLEELYRAVESAFASIDI